MKPINILLTCSSFHAVGIIDCLKNNPDNVPVNVFVTNCNREDLPPSECCDGTHIVPRIDSENYIDRILEICKARDIQIIFPTSSLELETMARYKTYFEDYGIKVSVSNLDSISIARDKIKSWEHFSEFMPKQKIAVNAQDVLDFSKEIKNICVKPTNLCGGKGFAVVDEEKCTDISYFHAYGKKHYITLWQLCKAVEKCPYLLILQEYHEGLDYCLLAHAAKGIMTHYCGCDGIRLEFGATMEGIVNIRPQCAQIAKEVIEKLNYDGIIGLDFIIKESGDIFLLDVNPRVTASAHFFAKAGVNIPWLQCKHLLGHDIFKEGKIIRNGLRMSKYFSSHYF